MKGGPHYAVGAGSCATTWYACHNVVSRPYNLLRALCVLRGFHFPPPP